MDWDYVNNLPIEGTFQHHVNDKDAMKAYINSYFPYDVVKEAFESVGWNLEKLLLSKYIELDSTFYISILSDWKEQLEDYWNDLANGHIVVDLPKNYTWGDVAVPIIEVDVYRRFFFCETEEDVWDVFYDLPDKAMEELVGCFYGQGAVSWFPVYLRNSARLPRMLEHFKNKQHGS